MVVCIDGKHPSNARIYDSQGLTQPKDQVQIKLTGAVDFVTLEPVGEIDQTVRTLASD